MCSFGDHAVNIALSNIVVFFDRELLFVGQYVCWSWQRTLCSVNVNQSLFRAVCLQDWPWLRDSFAWSSSGHHLWQHYVGSWKVLCQHANQANTVCTLDLAVPLDESGFGVSVQSPWVKFPGRGFQVRINAYPVGNRRMTTTHLSAYLEVKFPAQKKDGHTALDFTFVMQHPTEKAHEVWWSSGPVRFLERKEGASGRLDWGCHELFPMGTILSLRDGEVKPAEVLITSHVALQEAFVEVVHIDWLFEHSNDFGLCAFNGTFVPRHGSSHGARSRPVGLTLPASITKGELLHAVSRVLGRFVSRLWRFSRSLEVQGRLTCNLPEAPRHLLASVEEEEDDRNAVYALLTKWTLGESVGGTKQNFFRLLAQDDPNPFLEIEETRRRQGNGRTATVFVKHMGSDGTLRYEAIVDVPETEDVEQLLPAILSAVREEVSTSARTWCLVREGSPSDWVQDPTSMTCDLSELINSGGLVVNGDILVLCSQADLHNLSCLYQREYRRRVDNFVALYSQEMAQVGSVSFASICRVMDDLNVDAWRVEQLASSTSGSPNSMLALMSTLPSLHPQFFCDACGTRELRGPRFNCLVCSDFDLCETCYNKELPSVRPNDHHGRFHERSHRVVKVWPALPADCLTQGRAGACPEAPS
mmetsp:Transcript_12121/g.27491  ORF Transcript_12121/g.27491 Transcript_12121/m.27491 type:complete len:643 (-) Transcript_12121:356-2284(-)